jgi:5'(3')-deoxyribonucleotidase
VKRLLIGVDIDEVCNNLIWEVVQAYNKAYRQNLNYYDIDQYDIKPFLVPQCKNIWQEFCRDELMRGLQVEDTAVETLSQLAEQHDIYFVTAGHPNTMHVRDQWLSGKFPFYKTKMLIGCQQKQLLNLDILVDDYEQNLIGGNYRGFLMNRPWNRKFDAKAHSIERIDKVEDVLKYIA